MSDSTLLPSENSEPSEHSEAGASEQKVNGEPALPVDPRRQCPFEHCSFSPKKLSEMIRHFRQRHLGQEIPQDYRDKYMQQCPHCHDWFIFANKHTSWCSRAHGGRARAVAVKRNQSNSQTPVVLPRSPPARVAASAPPLAPRAPEQMEVADKVRFLEDVDVQTILRRDIPTIRDIAPRLLLPFSRCLREALADPLSNEVNAKLFLLLPSWLLAYNTHETRRRQEAAILQKCQRFLAGDWRNLHEEALGFPEKPNRPATVPDAHTEQLLRTASTLVHNGYISLAASRLTTLGVLDAGDGRVIEQLRDLHPEPRSEIPERLKRPKPPESQVSYTSEEVEAGLRTMARGKAPGPTGWRSEHFLSVCLSTQNPIHAEMLELLTKRLNELAADGIPLGSARLLLHSRLIPLRKKLGSDSVRPVAIGEVLLRLLGKLCVRRLAPKCTEFFDKIQFGVGIRGGVEIVLHQTRALANDSSAKCLLQIDATNAFNQIDRTAMLNSLEANFPEIYNYVVSAYGDPALLIINSHEPNNADRIIQSATGVRQGDPLGSFLFCLTIQPLLKDIRDRFNVDILAIADDILIAGPTLSCQHALDWMRARGGQIGFHINLSKSVGYIPNANNVSILEMQQLASTGLTVTSMGITALGVPIGTDAFQADALRKWLEEGNRMLEGIQAVADIVKDRHAAFLLLKYCYNARIGYLLRCVPPQVIADTAKAHDDKVEQAFQCIHSIGPMTRTALVQMRLPCKLGGLGIPSAVATSSIAYASSLALTHEWQASLSTANLTHDAREAGKTRREQAIAEVVANLGVRAAQITEADPLASITVPTVEQILAQQSHCQQVLTRIHYKCEHHHLLTDQELSDYELVRLKACSHPRAMRTFAIPHKGASRIACDEWRMAIHLALGIDVTTQGSICPGCHTELPDTKGVHLLTCKHFRGREVRLRHDSLVRHLKLFFSKAGAHVHLANQEELGWFAGVRRPDIVADVVQGPRMGQSILYDVTVVHPFKQVFRGREDLRKPGAAATAAEEEKRRKYAGTLLRPDVSTFVPLGFDIYGGWGASTTKEIEDHMARVAAEEGSTKNVFTDWLAYHLSAAIWVYSAASLFKRLQYVDRPNAFAIDADWHQVAYVADINQLEYQ